MRARALILALLVGGCAGSQYVAAGEGSGAVEVRLTAPAKLAVDIDGQNVYRGAQDRKSVTIGGVDPGQRIVRLEADAPGGPPVARTDTVSIQPGQTATLTVQVPEPSPAWGFAAGVVAAAFLFVVPLL